MIEEAEEGIVDKCRGHFRSIIAPGSVTLHEDHEHDDDERLLSLVCSDDVDVLVCGVLLCKDGEVQSTRRYPELLPQPGSLQHLDYKMADRDALQDYIERERPYYICIAASCMKARRLFSTAVHRDEAVKREEAVKP